jgi:5-(carboxyamino)imidazole ribonucleotide mutase
MQKIGIVMGSKSDLPVVQKAIDVLNELKIPYEAHIFSAHRTPGEAAEFARAARENSFACVIAFAGMAAHLAGAIAANTTLPVIGVPCKGPVFDGMDALLSTVQMPSGIPVATVAVNGGANAALLAAEILSVGDAELARRLREKRETAAAAILEQDAQLEKELSHS